MIKKIPINENIYIVFSHDEYGYSEVMDDFSNASFINISSYNIYAGGYDALLEKIKKLSPCVKVNIVSNIPNYEYNISNDFNKANCDLKNYKKALDPSNYNSDIISFFNFKNHSKIIMTNNIAYIGSENFSCKSKQNYECGIIIKDSKIIRQLCDDVFKFVIKNSSITIEEELIKIFEEIKHEIILIQDKLEKFSKNFHDGLYDSLEIHGMHAEYINPNGERKDIINFEELDELINEIEPLIEQYAADDIYYNRLNLLKDDIVKIRKLINAESIIEWLQFDSSRYVDNYIEEHYPDNEHLNGCNDKAIMHAEEMSEELFEKAKIQINDLGNYLVKLLDEIKMVIEIISARLEKSSY